MERFTSHERQWWEHLYEDDPLIPAWARQPVPASAPTSATDPGFESAKKAANHVGITPSNWSPGTMNQTRRAFNKEGAAPLRLVLDFHVPAVRRSSPGLARAS